jgi:ribosome-binding factor A
MTKRTIRLNSLLKQVIAEVIQRDVHNPKVSTLVTVTQVEVAPDLHNAKVFVSVIGSEEDRKQTLKALQSAAGFISVQAAQQVTIRYFPTLSFHLDLSVDAFMRIDSVLQKIHDEQSSRPSNS